jgi:molecular chaperone GrpE
MNPEFNNPSEIGVSELDLLRKELAEKREHNQRLVADFENFKRRTRSESEARAAAQKEAFILELLPFIDNLERALDSGKSANTLEYYQGVDLILKSMYGLLRKHGIETEDITGQPFDPHLHEAVSVGYDPSQAERAVLKVFQRGYRRGGNIYRPAKVEVNDLTHSNQARHVR